MLTLRPMGLSSPAYRDWLDYIVLEDGRAGGGQGKILASWQNATSARLARCPELRLGFPITDCDPEPGAGG